MRSNTVTRFKNLWVASVLLTGAAAFADDAVGPARDPAKKVAYLGITAKAVDPAVQARLKLPEGLGLSVRYVDPRGPAKTDIEAGDVLEKIDDQVLTDTHQLVTLVRLHRPGDSVTLSIIHQDKPVTIRVKLGEKELHAAASQASPESSPLGNATGGTFPSDPTALIPFDYQLQTTNTQTEMAFDDGTYAAKVSADDTGSKHMVVKDRQGKMVATGAVDTESDWAAFPQDVRDHLKVLHKVLFKTPAEQPRH